MSKAKGATSASKAVIKLDGGIKYRGEIKAGAPHTVNEPGIMEWPEGDKYEGHFRFGKRHGQGKRFNVDGSSYVGAYEED